jgi:nucleotide-binding universal stress UspA family protein
MFKRILVPTELSAASNSIFPWAATLAQAFTSKLYLVNVMPPSAIKGPEILEDFPHLNEFFPQDRELDFNPPLAPEVPLSKMFVYDRNEANILLRFAHEKKVDLIAVAATSKRIELTWWSAGKTVEKLIRDAPCSVFCVRGKRISERDWKRPHFRHVLLLSGLDQQTPALLQRVLPLVDRFQSVLHVFPLHGDRLKSSGEREALRQLCQIEGASPNVLFFTEPKNRMQNLLNFIADTAVDLIVMTPDTRAEFSNRLVSDILIQLLRLARCPVLLLR